MQKQRKIAAGILCASLSSAAFASLDTISPVTPPNEQKLMMTADHVQAVYQNLVEKHWVSQTGLFISFLDTADNKLSQQASTYEQGAVGLLALRMGDKDRARGIFQFLKKAWEEGPNQAGDRNGVHGLANFYNAEFGGEGIERTIHVGPNAWAGLFAAHLGNVTGNQEATAWALDVAHWISKEIPHDNGGVAMGPLVGPEGIPWPQVYSTENNISYYGLLSELLRTPQLESPTRDWLTNERNHVEDWLVTIAFDRLAYAMNRGANPFGADRVRALDTYTWLISAVGPERLQRRDIDPEKLMWQVESSFVVQANHLLGVDPADQSEADLTFSVTTDVRVHPGPPRAADDQHRMIWYEGLGQYINALNTMAAYFQKRGQMEKAAFYTVKAQQFVKQFDQASLKNYRFGLAYPYATTGLFFHDGWYTPADSKSGPASSLIAAVWRCYAGLGFDPLAGEDIASVPRVEVTIPEFASIEHPKSSVLYGTSEEMVVEAWRRMNAGETEATLLQAEAVIQEWAPWAHQLEEKKERDIGHVVDYMGLPEQQKQIFSYWALNDVAAAYFIMGKILDDQHEYVKESSAAFQEIARHYPLAQIWDPRGWFWSPLESIYNEYVDRDPRHYQELTPTYLAASSFLRQPN